MHHRTAFPEARIVVVLCNLRKSELLVVIWSHPFGGIDRTLLQRRVDIAAGELLWHHPDLLQHLTRNAADAEFETREIGNRLDLLAEPAAHLRSRVAGRETNDAKFLEQLVAELLPAALI